MEDQSDSSLEHKVEKLCESEKQKNKSKRSNFKNLETNYFLNLPNEILLMIFQNLDHQDLGRASQVCRYWYQIISNSALYGHIDFKYFSYEKQIKAFEFFTKQNRGVKKFVYAILGPRIDIKKYSGFEPLKQLVRFLQYYHQDLTFIELDNCFNENVVFKIGQCFQLTTLILSCCNLGCSWSSLLQLNKLKELELVDLEIETTILLKLLKLNKNLEVLKLTECSNISIVDDLLMTIRNSNLKLTTFSLIGAVSLTELSAAQFSEWISLEELQLKPLFVSNADKCLEEIAKGCPNLKKLFLRFWQDVTENSLLFLPRYLKKLSFLKFHDMGNVTDAFCENALANLPNLECFIIHRCGTSWWVMDDLRNQYPNVLIDDKWVNF